MASVKKSPRIFYGWWIVAAMVAINTYIGGVVLFGFTAFIDPIEESFPTWSRTVITFSVSLRGMESGLLAPFAGRLVDRYGPRRLIAIGSIIIAISLAMLSQINSLWMFYLAFVVLTLGMSTCTLTVPMTAVANWFHKKLGIASAFAIVGFGLSGVLVPVIERLISIYDWRNTFLILAVGAIIIILPLSLVFRHKPQPYGYLPDGERGPSSPRSPEIIQKPPAEKTWNMREVLSSGIFWRIVVSYICHMMLLAGVVTHLMPYLGSVGIERSSASFVTMALALSTIGSRLGFGWLADRFEHKTLAVAGFAVIAIGILFYLFVSDQAFWLVIPFVILFSVGHGGNNALRSPIIVSYFGRSNFGAVMGLMMGFCSIGSILGSPLTGLIWDKMGSYDLAWYIGLGIAVVGMLAIWSLPKTRQKPKRQF
ncbi:MFS transporter [Chloroflexota bacterium]